MIRKEQKIERSEMREAGSPKPEARSLKPEARAEANSAEIAGPAAGGAALQGVMPSCYTGNEKTVTGREISLQDGKISYRDAKKSRRTGDFVTGSTQNETGPVTAGNWRMSMIECRLMNNDLRCTGKNNHQTVKTSNRNEGNRLAVRSMWLVTDNITEQKIERGTFPFLNRRGSEISTSVLPTHRTPFTSLKGAGAKHWNTPLGRGGSAGQRGAGILSSNPSRFEKHLKVTPAFATQPLGVFQTLKVSENKKIREQKIKTASGKLKLSNRFPFGEVERGFFFLSYNGGAGGGFVANNLNLSAYET